jgi:hypothetical protein
MNEISKTGFLRVLGLFLAITFPNCVTTMGFNQIYLEEDGRIAVSKMAQPLVQKNEADYTMNHYYIFIENFI